MTTPRAAVEARQLKAGPDASPSAVAVRHDGPVTIEGIGMTTKMTMAGRARESGRPDRLTFAGQIIETGTTSYRLANARQRQAARSATQSK